MALAALVAVLGLIDAPWSELALAADAPGRFRGMTACDPAAIAAQATIRPPRLADPDLKGPVRKLVPSECRWEPPVLWSFPGSGNTWMRQLLEVSTGIATGSVYNDFSLLSLFPAERRCTIDVLVVKAHASHTPAELLRHWSLEGEARDALIPYHGGASPVDLSKTRVDAMYKHYFRKCKAWRPRRALLLDREPFDAIWSEYQRRFVGGDNGGHVARILESQWDDVGWLEAATNAAGSYVATWTSHRSFVNDVVSKSKHANGKNGARPSDVMLIVPFADMVVKCEAILTRALEWLAPPVSATSVHNNRTRWDVARACVRSDSAVKRPTASPEGEAYIDKARAWSPLVVCRVWATLGHVATALGHAFPGQQKQSGPGCLTRDQLALTLAGTPPDIRRSPGFPGSPGVPEDPILFLSAAVGELDVCLNWILSLMPSPGTNSSSTNSAAASLSSRLLIGAEGWNEYDALARLGAPAFPMVPRFAAHGGTRASEGWLARDGVRMERGEVCFHLVKAGHSVLIADVSDSVPGGIDPRTSLQAAAAAANADLVALASEPLPSSLLRASKNGSISASFHLGLWMSTPGSVALLGAIVAAPAGDGGDEGALNVLLARASPGDWTEAPQWGGLVVTIRLGAGDRGPMSVRVLLLNKLEQIVECDGPDAGAFRTTSPLGAMLRDPAAGVHSVSRPLLLRCSGPVRRPPRTQLPSSQRDLGGAVAQRLRRGGLWSLPTAWFSVLTEKYSKKGGGPSTASVPAHGWGRLIEPPTARSPVEAVKEAILGRSAFGASIADLAGERARLVLTIVVSATWLQSPTADIARAHAGLNTSSSSPSLLPQHMLDILTLEIATAATSLNIRVELIVVEWAGPESGDGGHLVILPEIPMALQDALRVRIVRVDSAAHKLIARRRASEIRSVEGAALNVGVRMASAELVMVVSFGARFNKSFFEAISREHTLRTPAGALASVAGGKGGTQNQARRTHHAILVGACVDTTDGACAIRVGVTATAVANQGAVGLIMPASLWHAARGFAEGTGVAADADRYLFAALERLRVRVGWLACADALSTGLDNSCASISRDAFVPWWRLDGEESYSSKFGRSSPAPQCGESKSLEQSSPVKIGESAVGPFLKGPSDWMLPHAEADAEKGSCDWMPRLRPRCNSFAKCARALAQRRPAPGA